MRIEPQHTKAIQLSGSRYEELKELKTPTLVIHGKSDPLVLFENAEKYAPLIPNVKTLYIDDLGHHFPEKYTPEITTTILNHLKTIN
jgi:pimeloyl-ACP methyl ester carboxylesterase